MNSKLVDYIKLSPNNDGARKSAIDRITPHCVVGQCSVETLGEFFHPATRKVSSNYGIGADGRVGMYVEEKDHSWCSSNFENDDRAITIECASDNFPPYKMNNNVYTKLIDLCTEICERLGKKKLIWFGDKTKTLSYKPAEDEMILTVHRWFSYKSCPGDWLYARLGEVAKRVTERLGGKRDTFYRVFVNSGQVGAYYRKDKAEAHVKRLKALGAVARMEEVTRADNT